MNKRKSLHVLALIAVLALLLPALVWAAYPAEVARTGQTTCYADNGTIIDCTGTGQDGNRLAGVPWPDPRFSVQINNQTVTDNLTGLMWSKNANLAGGSKTWQGALDYVAGMNAGTYENFGYTDWQGVPNVNELESLVNAELYGMALPQGHPFTNVNMSNNYWSSTSFANYTDCAWILSMYFGVVGYGSKTLNVYVWPVRSGQCGSLGNSIICLPRTGQTSCYHSAGTLIDCAGTGQDGELQEGVVWPDPRFIVQSDNQLVTDNLTGLMWAKNANLMVTRDSTFDTDSSANDGRVTWQHALDYIKKLNSEQYLNNTDWRLPNTRELRSLADYELFNIALPPTHPFTNVQSNSYWSSTSFPVSTKFAWIVDVNYGGVGSGGSKSNHNYVWPVRSGQCGLFDNSITTTSVGSTTSVSTTTTTAITTTSIISSTTTTTVSGKPCPAKKALGENNPNLQNLRDFRDSKLAHSAVGRKLIQIYYTNADSINAALERSPALRAVMRRMLEVVAPMVGR